MSGKRLPCSSIREEPSDPPLGSRVSLGRSNESRHWGQRPTANVLVIVGVLLLAGLLPFLFLAAPPAALSSPLDGDLEKANEKPRRSAATTPLEDSDRPSRQPVRVPASERGERRRHEVPADSAPNLTIRTVQKATGLPTSSYVALRVAPHGPALDHDESALSSQLLQTDASGTAEVRVSPGLVSGTAWTSTLLSSEAQTGIADSRATSTLVLELSPGSVIEGSVLSGSGGASIDGAEVFVPFINEFNVAFSSSDGTFRYAGFPADGSFTLLKARAEGYHVGFARVAIYPDGRWTVVSDGLSLEERIGDASTLPQVTLVLPVLASIEGRVVSYEGKPVPGAEVIAEGSYITSRSEGSMDRDTSSTDSDGFFHLDRLRSGLSHSLLIRADGFAQWLDVLDASAEPQRDVGVIRLGRESTVSGRIVESGGGPVRGLRVDVARPHRPSRSYAPGNSDHIVDPSSPGQDAMLDSLRLGSEARTDHRGEFEIGGLAEGSYLLEVHWNDVVDLYEEEIQVSRDSHVRRDIVLPSGPAIRGVIHARDESIASDMRLCLRTQSGRELCRIGLESSGRFGFPGLVSAAKYELWLEQGAGNELIRSKLGTFVPGQENLILPLP